jgi:hypothetical protein
MICGLSSQPIKKNKNAERMAKGRKKTNQHQIAPRNVPNVAISKVETTSFQGPLPHPQILSQYDQIVPGSAERIISQWESQSRHRQLRSNPWFYCSDIYHRGWCIFGLYRPTNRRICSDYHCPCEPRWCIRMGKLSEKKRKNY